MRRWLQVDVIKLARFDSVWPPADPAPVQLERVALQDIFQRQGSEDEGLLRRFFEPATLQVCHVFSPADLLLVLSIHEHAHRVAIC
jgi:hypothetical protein